jgi:hypothetical protein
VKIQIDSQDSRRVDVVVATADNWSCGVPAATFLDLWSTHRKSATGDPAVPLSAETIYRSSNGDLWRLIRENGRVFVRHEANPSSGGSVTDTDVDEFLSVGVSGPEFATLRRILELTAGSGRD